MFVTAFGCGSLMSDGLGVGCGDGAEGSSGYDWA